MVTRLVLPSVGTIRKMSTAATTEIATFANGCFWGTEHMYRKYFGDGGLLDAAVGYIGGDKKYVNPSYQQVCTGKTGHAECTQLKFDPVCASKSYSLTSGPRFPTQSWLNFSIACTIRHR